MKSRLILIITLLISLYNYAQQGINYKALVKDVSGNIIANTTVTVQFQILQNTTNVYQETHVPTTDANGIFIVNIGEGSVDSGVYADIDWSSDDHFLNVQINTGSGLVDIGTTQFMAVPYALSADNVTGLEQITEAGNTGWRLVGANSNNYADIGNNAIDLSFSSTPSNNGASGDNSYALGTNTIASGDRSLAIGLITEASGMLSTAIGSITTASGNFSTAIGRESTASGNFSIAMGTQTEAEGWYSSTMGFNTIANSYASLAVGRYNTGIGSATTWVDTDPVFEIGNGTSDTNRTNALSILKNGTITAPTFDISEITDDKALITKEYLEANASTATGLEQITEAGNTGWRLVGSNSNNYGNIGNNAIDFSVSNTTSTVKGATGTHATAMGQLTKASGINSTAMGLGTRAESNGSTAIGRFNVGGGIAGLTSPSDPIFEIGNGTGDNDSNRSNALTVLRNGTHIIKKGSDFIPNIILEGSANTPFGDNGLITSDPNLAGSDIFLRTNDAVVIELDADDNENGQFEIRAGDGSIVFEVRENGNATLAGSLTQNSDRRLKKDIVTIPYGLKEILQLQPKAYNWKSKEQDHKSLGLIAQDVQPIIKNIVNIGNDKENTLGVSYTELIPVLIKALQEQQDIINSQKKRINTQNSKIEGLSAEVEDLKTLEGRIKQIESILKTQ